MYKIIKHQRIKYKLIHMRTNLLTTKRNKVHNSKQICQTPKIFPIYIAG